MNRYKKRTTREILAENLGRTPPAQLRNAAVWLHNIRSMYNVGAAFRSCDAFGCGHLYLSGYTPVPPRPEISKTALGADETVSWSFIKEPLDFLTTAKQAGSHLVGIEQTKDSGMLTDFRAAPGQKVIFFFGNEVTGLDDALLPLMDQCLEIPQFGHKHSLNVSVTIGTVLYHMLLSSIK
ncbi:MAG: TrmH family RNA methyltransferase [Candidatus Cyclonatronum sp.]|uniref:TrmH family RNA methyltransferase n=1 Tax=Cyclonatronum sp. TaxID=3024185 RepID=UPI0025C3F97D|nr:TrmH family RNA methyltransferase [Cyclonatronum sp.]MCC5933262.1 TrmH family RNA methyltransferase [Balneolales bacterium]MCH8485417.1 TrmH family RNA methyltransferase [Cyclonatronum sp.]